MTIVTHVSRVFDLIASIRSPDEKEKSFMEPDISDDAENGSYLHPCIVKWLVRFGIGRLVVFRHENFNHGCQFVVDKENPKIIGIVNISNNHWKAATIRDAFLEELRIREQFENDRAIAKAMAGLDIMV